MANDIDLRDPSVLDPGSVPSALAAHLAAAAAPPSAGELAGERAAVAAFAATTTATTRARAAGGRRGVRARRGVLVAAAAFGLLGVSAAAATGSLPDAAQDVARTTLTKVGVDVPAGKGQGLDTAPGQLKEDGTAATPAKAKAKAVKAKATPRSSKPAGTDTDADTDTDTDTDSKADGTHPDNKGAVISDLAHQEYPSGAEKGATISNAASGGRSQAGEGQPADPQAGRPSATSPGVTAPGRTTATPAGPKGP